jgi:hypothetical protein
MIIKFMLLAVLVRLLLATNKPFLCSGIYAGVAFALGLVLGNPFVAVLIHASISFVLASIYFWLLERLAGSSEVLWWLVAIGGIVIGLV